MNKSPLMNRLLKWGVLTAIAASVLVWPVRALLAGQAHHVFVVSQHLDPAVISTNKGLLDLEGLTAEERREEVIDVYGTALSEEDVLFVDEARIIRPKEVPGLALLPKTKDENPLKMDTVHYLTPRVSIGAAVVALLMLGLLQLLKRRRTVSAQMA